MAQLQIYYKNGNYEEFNSVLLPFSDGYLLQNEFIKSDNIKEDGIIWERSYFATEEDDPEGEGGTIRQFQIIKPIDLDKIEAIVLNGNNQIIIPSDNQNNEDEINENDEINANTP